MTIVAVQGALLVIGLAFFGLFSWIEYAPKEGRNFQSVLIGIAAISATFAAFVIPLVLSVVEQSYSGNRLFQTRLGLMADAFHVTEGFVGLLMLSVNSAWAAILLSLVDVDGHPPAIAVAAGFGLLIAACWMAWFVNSAFWSLEYNRGSIIALEVLKVRIEKVRSRNDEGQWSIVMDTIDHFQRELVSDMVAGVRAHNVDVVATIMPILSELISLKPDTIDNWSRNFDTRLSPIVDGKALRQVLAALGDRSVERDPKDLRPIFSLPRSYLMIRLREKRLRLTNFHDAFVQFRQFSPRNFQPDHAMNRPDFIDTYIGAIERLSEFLIFDKDNVEHCLTVPQAFALSEQSLFFLTNELVYALKSKNSYYCKILCDSILLADLRVPSVLRSSSDTSQREPVLYGNSARFSEGGNDNEVTSRHAMNLLNSMTSDVRILLTALHINSEVEQVVESRHAMWDPKFSDDVIDAATFSNVESIDATDILTSLLRIVCEEDYRALMLSLVVRPYFDRSGDVPGRIYRVREPDFVQYLRTDLAALYVLAPRRPLIMIDLVRVISKANLGRHFKEFLADFRDEILRFSESSNHLESVAKKLDWEGKDYQFDIERSIGELDQLAMALAEADLIENPSA